MSNDGSVALGSKRLPLTGIRFMKSPLFIAGVILAAGCSRQGPSVAARSGSKPTVTADSDSAVIVATTDRPDTEKAESDEIKPLVEIETLTNEQQAGLLGARLDGGMGFTFGQFANMFLATSRIHLEFGVGLMTSSREISGTTLQSPFPRSYKPTLREFLDAIALQTFSEWKYDPSSKYVKTEGQPDSPVKGLKLAIF